MQPMIGTKPTTLFMSGDPLDYMIQKDFRFAQFICISSGIKIQDSDTKNFGQYGNDENDYVFTFLRHFIVLPPCF